MNLINKEKDNIISIVKALKPIDYYILNKIKIMIKFLEVLV